MNAEAFKEELRDHPDSELVYFVISGIEEGFSIGFEGPEESFVARNMPSIEEHPKVVENYMQEELKLGRIRDPFDAFPFPVFRSNQNRCP